MRSGGASSKPSGCATHLSSPSKGPEPKGAPVIKILTYVNNTPTERWQASAWLMGEALMGRATLSACNWLMHDWHPLSRSEVCTGLTASGPRPHSCDAAVVAPGCSACKLQAMDAIVSIGPGSEAGLCRWYEWFFLSRGAAPCNPGCSLQRVAGASHAAHVWPGGVLVSPNHDRCHAQRSWDSLSPQQIRQACNPVGW